MVQENKEHSVIQSTIKMVQRDIKVPLTALSTSTEKNFQSTFFIDLEQIKEYTYKVQMRKKHLKIKRLYQKIVVAARIFLLHR